MPPVSYTLKGEWFQLLLEGEYTPEDIKRVFASALQSPELPAEARFPMDVTRSESLASRSSGAIRDMAMFLGRSSDRFGPLGIAAGAPVHIGLMRMAAVYAELGGFEVRGFPNADEALDWLGRPDPG